MATVQDLIPYIYHEKQEEGEMLCAQHALNSLLQGQYFSAPDLSEIARELDEDESRELDADERATTSNNMDDTGFFSVQVLQRALSRNFELSLVQWGAEELRPYHEHPHTQMAFVLNYSQHWYTLRRFGNVSPDPAPEADPGGGHWFNLNSFNDRPERIGKLYLGMFLQEAQHKGYSIFAVIQQDITAKPALPRVEIDHLFASIPEDAAGNFSHSYASASTSAIEGFENEDMELQAALQASLAGGDYGDHSPQRFEAPPPPPPAPQPRTRQLPSRTSSGVPIRRDYQVIEPDLDADEDDDDEDEEADVPMRTEPEDPIAASMARQAAMLDRMRRMQEMALREQYQDEVARLDRVRARRAAGAGAGEDGDEDEDEDEMLRRAIAESEALAQEQGQRSGSGADEEEEDEQAPAPAAAAPAWHQHRVYDDEDQELQAALRASLETVPPGFHVPSPPPEPQPQPQPAPSRFSRSQETTPPATLQPPPLEREPSSDIETESEADVAEPEPQLSMEEIRRRRLARFGS